MAWTGFIWLRIGTLGGNELLGWIKFGDYLPDCLFASQEGLCFVEVFLITLQLIVRYKVVQI
jgi:hypothetical protein